MRRFLPLVAILAFASAFAQEPAQTATPSSSNPAADNYGIPPAPKPGHPLDPNDVATLTGKNSSARTQQNYATPQVYYNAPVGGSMFTQSSVGNAFMGSNAGYGVMINDGAGRYFGGYNQGGWGYTSNLSGSQFANVSTATRPSSLFFGPKQRPGAPIFGRPGRFTPYRWRPNYGRGLHFNHPTGLQFSPSLQP